MNELSVPGKSRPLPALFTGDAKARSRVRDLFPAHIRNPHTQRPAALRYAFPTGARRTGSES
jgi:hypothetical protein